MNKFKVGMEVTRDDGIITQVEDIYFSGEFQVEIIQCADGNSYINDEWCEVKPIIEINKVK